MFYTKTDVSTNDLKEFVDGVNSPPTLKRWDMRHLRSSGHQHHKIFKDYSMSEQNAIVDFIIKQHNNCHDCSRQNIYYEDLLNLGYKISRTHIWSDDLDSDGLYFITNVEYIDRD